MAALHVPCRAPRGRATSRVKQAEIQAAFERFLRTRGLKLTSQRQRLFERAFSTHEHFSAETLYRWLREEDGPRVSRATVYRTLALLLEGGFIQSLDTGRDELMYEHTLGHRHHDHMVCQVCGRIEEFHDPRIEVLQAEAAAAHGFELESHDHRLFGTCRACLRTRASTAPAQRKHAAPAGTAQRSRPRLSGSRSSRGGA
jgi:Fur family ferric uptake transcriptional regulator